MNDLEGEQAYKKVKTVPVRIIQSTNTVGASEAPQKFKKCNLYFPIVPITQSEQSTNDNGITNNPQGSTVTIPLGFFQQLLLTAWQNKQMMTQISGQQHLDKIQFQQQIPAYQSTPKLQQKKLLCEDLINEIQQQHKNYQKPSQPQKPNEAFVSMIEDAIKFVLNHKESTILIQGKLKNDPHLISYFINWVQQHKFQKVEDVQLACSSNLRSQSNYEERCVEHFKDIFKQLLFEYLRRHAFCDSMRNQHTFLRLELTRDLLYNIQKPGEFYTFQ